MIKSIYDKNELNITESATIEFTAEERNMIANAMAICLPKECDPIPIFELVDKIITG